jgi:hypothetical protein
MLSAYRPDGTPPGLAVPEAEVVEEVRVPRREVFIVGFGHPLPHDQPPT